ncbi:MAG: glycosyltransferase family 39 protein [Planctomycetota bacterium]
MPEIRADDIRADAAGSPTRGVWLGLVLVTALAAALRLFRLGHGGLWYDELIMARLTAGDLAGVWHDIVAGRPALYPVLAWAWEQAWGSGDAALRSLSAVLGVLTVPAVFFAGRRLFDRRVGLIAALFCAVSPFQVYYSQEHRYYALLLLLGTLSIWCLLAALGWPGTEQRPMPRRGGWAWRGYVLSSVLMFYTHPISACLLLSMGVAVLLVRLTGGLRPGELRRFLISQVVILGLILPWLVVPLMQVARHVEAPAGAGGNAEATGAFVPWIAATPWWAPVRTVLNFLLLGKRFVRMDVAALGVVVLVLGVVWAFLWRGAGCPRNEHYTAVWRAGRSWWLGVCWAGGAIMLTAAVSWSVKPIYVDRYVIVTAAGLYVLLGAGLEAVRRWLPTWAGAAALVVVMGGALSQYYEDPQKGAWREAAAWLDEHLEPGDTLAFTSERGSATETAHVRENWFWYARQAGAGTPIDVHVRDEPAVVARRLALAVERSASPADMARGTSGDVHGGGGVWLVMWRDPDHPVGFNEAFAAGPLAGLRLEQTRTFFDLVLTRFVPVHAPGGMPDSGVLP